MEICKSDAELQILGQAQSSKKVHAHNFQGCCQVPQVILWGAFLSFRLLLLQIQWESHHQLLDHWTGSSDKSDPFVHGPSAPLHFIFHPVLLKQVSQARKVMRCKKVVDAVKLTFENVPQEKRLISLHFVTKVKSIVSSSSALERCLPPLSLLSSPTYFFFLVCR